MSNSGDITDFTGPLSPAQLEELARRRTAPTRPEVELPQAREEAADYPYQVTDIPLEQQPGANTSAPAFKPGTTIKDYVSEYVGDPAWKREANKDAREKVDPSALVGPPKVETPPSAAPKPVGGGGGGGALTGSSNLSAQFAGQLGGDYSEQIAAMERERDARSRAADVEAQGVGDVAGVKRQLAADAQAQATGNTDEGRRRLADIERLTHAYVDGEVDPDKYWHDKSVPQKIATILGAGLMGFAGQGPAALNMINSQIDRSIALQQSKIDRNRIAAGHYENLYGYFLSTSKNEQEAYDKTRATLLDAAMADSAKAGIAAKSDINRAQMDQFIASLKMQRDEILARLRASTSGGGGGGGGGPQGWLQVADTKHLVTGADGQQYMITNPTLGDDVTNAQTAYKRIKEGLAQGEEILRRREFSDYVNPLSANVREGEAVDAALVEAVAKLSSSRGVPSSVLNIVRREMPQFGSRTGQIDLPKIRQLNKLLDTWEKDTLQAAGAIPVDVKTGAGSGKKAGEFTYYARVRQGGQGSNTSQAPAPEKPKYSTVQLGQ